MTDASGPGGGALRVTRPAWVWGGAFLAASVLPRLGQAALPGAAHTVVVVLGELLACAALVLFAVGRDSVVRRRPLGVAVLVLLGAWPLLQSLAWALLPVDALAQDPSAAFGLTLAGYAEQLVPAVLALVAVVQVWRAGVVPRVFRWVPAAALALRVVPSVVGAVVVVAMPRIETDGVSSLVAISSLCDVAAIVGLGVVAIVAGLQPRRSEASAVPVYPSPPSQA